MAEKKKVAKKKATIKESLKVAPKVAPKKVVVKEPLPPKLAPKPAPVERVNNFDEVASLLEHARKCHLAAKVYARGEARPAGFKAHWQTACDARRRADELDPQHLAPDWKAEEGFAGKDTHKQLMAFYESVRCV